MATRPAALSRTPTIAASSAPQKLLRELRDWIHQARASAARAVDERLCALYWRIGTRVRQEILKGKRADYGAKIVSAVGRELESEFGRGFSEKSLRHMIRFAEAFPHERIVSALRRQLTWTHFKRLLDMAASGICVASYWTEVLPRQQLERKLHEAVVLARGRQKNQSEQATISQAEAH